MLKTIRIFAFFVFLAGGMQLLSADEPTADLKKSQATTEETKAPTAENGVSSRTAGGTDQVKESEESEPLPIAAQGSPELLQAILAAWRERAKNTTAVRVSWKEQVRISPGGIASPEVAKHMFPEKFWKTGLPVSEISFNYQAQLLVDGGRVRFETQVIAVDENWDLYTEPYVSSFDGNSSRMLFSGEKASGSIRKEQHNVDAPSYVLHSLFLFMRPLNPTYATFDEQLLQFDNSADISETKKAIVLKQQGKGITDLVWVDFYSPYVVTRWEEHVDRPHHPTSPGMKLAIAADIKYASDPTLGHVPVSWTVVEFNTLDNSPWMQYEATDVKFEVLQQPVPQSDFTLEFPKGIEVYDHNTKASTIAGVTENRHTAWKTLMIANLIILVLVIAVVMYRRKRQIQK